MFEHQWVHVGEVAQLGEQQLCKLKVEGSTPFFSTVRAECEYVIDMESGVVGPNPTGAARSKYLSCSLIGKAPKIRTPNQIARTLWVSSSVEV